MKINNGFTLLEVLIAMLVLAFGLLGLAGLQATGLKNTLGAYNKSQATQLAYEMADRMRVNVIEAEKNATSTYSTIELADAEIQDNCLLIAGCTAVEMAENDLYEWRVKIVSLFPNSGTGEVEFVDPIYTITVNWDDDRDGDADSDDPEFKMSFQL